jgi:hypothetical protein
VIYGSLPFLSSLVWFGGLVGFSFNASLGPQRRARKRGLAEAALAHHALWDKAEYPENSLLSQSSSFFIFYYAIVVVVVAVVVVIVLFFHSPVVVFLFFSFLHFFFGWLVGLVDGKFV